MYGTRIPMKTKIILALLALSFSSSSNAALISRLGGLAYYDDVNHLTWFATTVGTMTWADADLYVSNMNVNGVTGWRLPNFDPGCTGYCSTPTEELGVLFYDVLGGVANTPLSVTHNANYALFSVLQDGRYWTNDSPNVTFSGGFDFLNGSKFTWYADSLYNVLAVHSGDVSAVPVPAAVWLFGSGLLGLLGVARRKRI